MVTVDQVIAVNPIRTRNKITAINTSNVSVPVITPPVPSPPIAGDQIITVIAANNLLAGHPVFITSSGLLDKAHTVGVPCVGIVINDAVSGHDASYISNGSVSSPDWTSIIGSQYLTPSAVYYLSSAGKLSLTPPASGLLQQVGIAVSRTMLDVEIKPPIQLA